MKRNLRELPKLRDSLSFLYVEHAKIEREGGAISLFDKEGETHIPIASLGVLMFGPGTTVSQEAIKLLAESGCSFLWVGENGVRLYGQGMGETKSSSRLLKQVKLYADKKSHMDVVLRMYKKRFNEDLSSELSLEQIRGKEGVRVRTAYNQASLKYDVEWKGRDYDRKKWNSSDHINRALSTASSCLYGVSHCAIISAGYSPSLGFIHTGHLLSFVYDIADLYRVNTIIELAFDVTSKCQKSGIFGDLERMVRLKCRDVFFERKILKTIINDIDDLMKVNSYEFSESEQEDCFPGELWNP